MTILLLGGTGFLGIYLRECLTKNYELDFTYANHPTDGGICYRASENNLQQLTTKRYDVVINNINPLHLSYNDTVKETENIISYCKTSNSKLIQISSVSALYQNRFVNSYNLKKALVDDLIQTELLPTQYSIVRFTQLFDAVGLSRSSQAGLYYLLKEIKQNKPITILANYKDCLRNYMPVELAVNAVDTIINNKLTGVFNTHLDKFTLSFDELINQLISLNTEYKGSLITVGDKIGLPYYVEKQSDDLISKMNETKELLSYFKNAYELI